MAELPPDKPVPPPPPGMRSPAARSGPVPPPPGFKPRSGPPPSEPKREEAPPPATYPAAGWPAMPPGMQMPWMQAPWPMMPPGMPGAMLPPQASWGPPPSSPQGGYPQPPAPPAPPAGASDADRRVAELERRLQAEREKVLLANLKNQEEKVVAARVETSIKEVQDKLRQQRRESEHEESRLKLEGRVQELENRLVQERETWVTTLRTQVGQRETQDKEIETHLTSRLQEMERRWLEEKAHWQRVISVKEDELRKSKEAVAERDEARQAVKSLDQEKKIVEGKAAELQRAKSELEARVQGAQERERDFFQVKAELEKARDQVRTLQERYDRDLQSARLSAKEREDRSQGDNERLQNDLLTVTHRLRLQHDAELQQARTEFEAKARSAEARGAAAQEDAAVEVKAIAARYEAASRKDKEERSAEAERLRAQVDQAQGGLARLRAVCAALERQAGALRAGALDGRKAKEDALKQLERYKGEFLVLQRKWVDREAEVRSQAAAEAAKLMESEKLKLKVRAQEEVQARVLRVQQQLRAELEAEFAEKERRLRAEAEKALAEKARQIAAEAMQARSTLEVELDRRAEEARAKGAQVQELLAQRDAELTALRSQKDESRGRLSREEAAREEDRVARLAYEKELVVEKARIQVMQNALEEARVRAKRDEEREIALTAERDTVSRERTSAEGKGLALSRELEAARQTLSEAADIKGGLDGALEEARAEVKRLEERRKLDEEMSKRKIEILRREAEARVSALEAERDSALAVSAAVRREAEERLLDLESRLPAREPSQGSGLKEKLSKMFGTKAAPPPPPPEPE